jgi:tRNA pseudouridine55 synthase
VGHAGTLDPMATGVLVVGVGRATRLLGHLSGTSKDYSATIRLGQSTVTDDAEGDVVSSADASALGIADVAAAMATFRGDIEQIPSSVSAVKVNGVRAYARVRAGEDVQLKARSVSIERFEATAFRSGSGVLDVDVEVSCSSGTYVRALARDLGAALEVGGHLTALRRTRVGAFRLNVASPLAAIQEAPQQCLVSIDEVARLSFTCIDLDESAALDVRCGRRLPDLDLEPATVTALFGPAGEFLALYEASSSGARPVAVFS